MKPHPIPLVSSLSTNQRVREGRPLGGPKLQGRRDAIHPNQRRSCFQSATLLAFGLFVFNTLPALAQPVVTNATRSVYARVTDPQKLAFAPDGTLFTGRDASGSGGGSSDAVAYGATGAITGTPGAVIVGGVTADGSGQGRLSKISPDGTVTTLFGPSSSMVNPGDFTFDSTGRLLFTDSESGKVWAMTNATPVVLMSGLTEPSRIAMDALGRIVVSFSAEERLRLYSAAGALLSNNFVTARSGSPIARGPGGMWGTAIYYVDPDGNLRTVDTNGSRATVGSGFEGTINDLEFGPDGALYASDFDNDRIFRFAQPAVPNATTTIYARVTDPVTVTFAPDGTVFVGRDASGSGGGTADAVKIHRVAPGGSPVTEFGNAAIADPDAVIFDASGKISGTAGAVIVGGVTADGNGEGRLSKIMPDGSVAPLFGPSSSMINPSDFVFDAAGRLLFADGESGSIWVMTNGTPRALVTGLDGTSRIAVDSLDRIAVSTPNESRVRLYNATGASVTNTFVRTATGSPLALGPGGFWGTGVFCVSTNGDLLIVDVNGNATQFGTGFGGLTDFGFGPDGALYASDFQNDRVWRITASVIEPNHSPSLSLNSPANSAIFTAPATIVLEASASDPDGTITAVEFFSGSTKLGEDTTAPYSFTWNNVAVGTYTLTAKVTDNLGSSTTSAAVIVTIISAPVAPTITTQPQGQTADIGANVSFTVVASGNPAPSYQWRKNGTNIVGATNATLTLRNVQAAYAGSYTVVVTNAAGSVTSTVATLKTATPVPVALKIRAADSGAVVSWPATARNYILQCADQLASAGWRTATNLPVVVGDELTVRVVATSLADESKKGTALVYVTEAAVTSEYYPQPLVPGVTTDESNSLTTTVGQPARLSLSDGTRLEIPALTAPVTVTLTRTSNTLDLGVAFQQVSGSMRVVTYTGDITLDELVPLITFPANEAGSLKAVNIARVGDLTSLDGVSRDKIVFLPARKDASGNLSARDVFLRASEPSPVSLLARAKPLAGATTVKITYGVSTYQGNLNWSLEPKLLRMVPNPEFDRTPLSDYSKEERDEILRKPIQNVVLLVHGHNEAEKFGHTQGDIEHPWCFAYKRAVWNFLYGQFQTDFPDYADCTAFYEYIYPSFRPIFGGPESLGEDLARRLAEDRRLKTLNQKYNLFVVAHSMGGLVARAALNKMDSSILTNFEKLITWSTPHHGSPAITLRHLLLAEYKLDGPDMCWLASLELAREFDTFKEFVNSQAVDTPGERHLRWDNYKSLGLDDAGWSLAESQKDTPMLDLQTGSYLYNDDLRLFNAQDRFKGTDKYVAFYGTTSKTVALDWSCAGLKKFYQAGNIAKGSALIEWLYDNWGVMVGYPTEPASNKSDGAVPVDSMVGVDIIPRSNAIWLGDVDHEEYFQILGEETARRTLETLKLKGREGDKCDCPSVTVNPIQRTLPTAQVTGMVVWPGDPKPGLRVQQIATLERPAPFRTVTAAQSFQLQDDGNFNATFDGAALPSGGETVEVLAQMKDGSELTAKTTVVAAGYIDVRISSNSRSVILGESINLTFKVVGIASQEVTWHVEEGDNKGSFAFPAPGMVVFTPSVLENNLTLVATSNTDKTIKGGEVVFVEFPIDITFTNITKDTTEYAAKPRGGVPPYSDFVWHYGIPADKTAYGNPIRVSGAERNSWYNITVTAKDSAGHNGRGRDH